MIVIDASVVANLVGDDGADGSLAREEARRAGGLAAPDLVDVETVAVLRKRWLARDLSERRFDEAVQDLIDLEIDRYPVRHFMRRAFELRANVNPYDAVYVALAEGLGVSLVTADKRLREAPGPRCTIRVLAGR